MWPNCYFQYSSATHTFRKYLFDSRSFDFAQDDMVARLATTSWRRLAPLAKYTVSASYGAPAAGSSIPKGHSSRSAVAALEVSLRKNSLCDFWLKLAQAVSIFHQMCRFWLQLGPESHKTRLRCHPAHQHRVLLYLSYLLANYTFFVSKPKRLTISQPLISVNIQHIIMLSFLFPLPVFPWECLRSRQLHLRRS